MSILEYVRYEIACDECCKRFKGSSSNSHKLVQLATKAGWKLSMVADLCPDCWHRRMRKK